VTNKNRVRSGSAAYAYDNLNRLDLVSGAYTDDPGHNATTGNLTSKGGTTLTYGAQSINCPDGALNKPHAVITAGTNTYCYDPNGNVVKRTIGGVTYTLTYDYENRMTGVTGGSTTAAFVYDGDGNRVKSTINGTTVYYVGNYFETSDTLATTKTYFYEGSVQVAMRKNSALTYLFSDQLGSNTYATDVNGTFKFEIRYKDWGCWSRAEKAVTRK
jgi:YD repeat-containing protein